MHPLACVELNVWLMMLADILADWGSDLDQPADQQSHFQGIADRVHEQIETLMWDEGDGFYYDVASGSHEKVRVRTPFGFMPLLSGRFDASRKQQFVEQHLLDPEQFWTRYPLPSVAINHPTFDARDMWRGPSWVNLNWLVIEGLMRSGFADTGQELLDRTVQMVGPMRNADGDVTRSPMIYEWYDPFTAEALGNAQYTWSGLIVDLLIRYGQK